MPSIENSLALLLNQVNGGRLTLQRAVEVMCDAPARVWDIIGKGRIVEGYDADLVLVDLQKTRQVRNEEQHARCGWSAWNGVRLTGWPVRTWVMGHQVYCEGKLDTSRLGQPAQFDHARGGYWTTGDS